MRVSPLSIGGSRGAGSMSLGKDAASIMSIFEGIAPTPLFAGFPPGMLNASTLSSFG